MHSSHVKSNGVFTPEQDNDKTMTRQRQDNDNKMLNLCIPMMPFTPGLSCRCRTWCERHHRNAQVQHLFVVVLSLSCSGVKTPLPIEGDASGHIPDA